MELIIINIVVIGVHLEEGKEDLEIRGCSNNCNERELTTWNGSTGKNGEGN